ncbi:hypothetical protein MKW94_024370 [Papaver nudicaule]|uniref:Uncharacterized protein n=1 Tax=Papaver nudicaule TaxID=74823 RepID=A0AA41RVS5_PAPNU|nr:hypothetical protein [Papaver nudicaule]
MRFSKFQRGEEESSDSDYNDYLAESSKQAERRFKHSSKNPLKSKSGSKEIRHRRRKKTLKRPRQFSSSSSDDDDGENDVIRIRGFTGSKYGVEKMDSKRRKLHAHKGDDCEPDPDYVMYLESLAEDREEENFEDDVVGGDGDVIEEEEEDRNEDILVDMDREMEMDGNGIDFGDDADPEYKMFLENLREDGKSYVLEMTSEKGNSVYVKYEEPLPAQFKKKVQSDDLGGNTSHQGKRGFATNKIHKEGPVNYGSKEMPSRSLPPRPSKEKSTPINDSYPTPPPPKCIKRNSSAINYDSRLTPLPPKGCKKNSTPIHDSHATKVPTNCSKKNSALINGSHPFLDEFKGELTYTVDESYYTFLKSVRVKGKAMFIVTDDVILEYGEENMVTPSVPGKSAKDGVPCKKREFETHRPRKCRELHMDEDDLDTEYEKKLLKIINMPFDEKEYRDKYRLATKQKRVEKTKEMRGRSVSYYTDEMGLSYLDHHPGLKEMVDRAIARSDARKALLLLRCLFFYNENVAQEGSFVPWKQPSFMSQILGRA